MKRVFCSVLALLVSLIAATPGVSATSDTCYTTGDIDGNGTSYDLSDLVMLTRFVNGEGPPPDPLHEGDLNADGYIDYGDVANMDSVIQGLLIPLVPNLVGCNPDTLRGACFVWDTCFVFSAANCFAAEGLYVGDGRPCGCYADGDINHNEIAYEIADRVYLARFVVGNGPPPDPLYEGDLNADGYVDQGDVAFLDSVINGYLAPDTLILTVCDPDTIRGGCWEYDSCVIRSAENCAAFGDVYAGDGTSCEGPCYATGDLNRNGIAFEISDRVFLTNFVLGFGPPPDPLHAGDLNADGFVDETDVAYVDSVVRGDLPPPPGPILTGCYPDTIRGACDEGDTCLVLAPANCAAAGGVYVEDGVYCYCYADGDINQNGIAFEIGDWVLLRTFIHGYGLHFDPLHEGDVNGDGFIDDLDVGYLWGVIWGDIAPPGIPIMVNCDPDTIRGGCQMGDTCLVLAPDNCAAVGGMYQEDGVYCYCYANGDINGDGLALSVADMVYLLRFIHFGGAPPDPLYRGDLNTDGYIDIGDCILLDSLITYEQGYPRWSVPTSCYPPNTVRGGCLEGDSCLVRSAENCAACGGTYLGDSVFCACDCAGLGDLDLNGAIDPLDVTILVNFVYKGWHTRELILTCPVENGDWDCSGTITPVDVAYCVQHVFKIWGSPPCDPCIE